MPSMLESTEENGGGAMGGIAKTDGAFRCYTLDSVHNRLVAGQRLKCFTMMDPCSEEVPHDYSR